MDIKKCAVCKTECDENTQECSICGFADKDGICREEFITWEDACEWVAKTVFPYARKWFKRQLSELREKEAELLQQMDVQLNSRARNELAMASAQESINAQAALA